MRIELDTDPLDVADVVGQRSFLRGLAYMRQDAVMEMSWQPSGTELLGIVHGSRDQIYGTSAYFDHAAGGPLRFTGGTCTCPVGIDCKHVAALVLSVILGDAHAPDLEEPPTLSWERSLGAILDTGPANRSTAVPLALELSLYAKTSTSDGDTARVRLRARLVEPGKNGWIGGSLDWSLLTSLRYRGFDPDHVRLLRELYALHQAHADPAYHYCRSNLKWLDLTDFGSARLWSLLDEARSVGLKLVYGRKGAGEVARYDSAELHLDVTEHGEDGAGRVGGLAVSPVVTISGAEVDPVVVGFVGDPGHGLVYAARTETVAHADPARWRPRLARLAGTVPEPLQRMVLNGQPLVIPADARSRFRDAYYPRLRQLAAVRSSDESFTPPVISGPTLMVRLDHGTGHRLDIDYEWAYQVGDTRARHPLHSTVDTGHRDPDAERQILDALPIPPDKATLDGVDTLRFATEVLPLLADTPGVSIEASGTPVDYHEVSDSLTIGVSTSESPGETDWFDLGVQISAAGHQVPFGDVFAALARGESHLLLADGSYFSLDKPELRELARLIEEARTLTDASRSGLRISRFQAGLWEELAALGVVSQQAAAWKRQVTGLLSTDDTAEPPPPPELLDAHLRPYQLDGYAWLTLLWRHRLGGVLADDMGLGKTLQALALICHAKQTDPGDSRLLVVAPTSVVSNWAAEAARFAPGLRVVAVTDTLRRSGRSIGEITADADVVVTSYTLFRLDFDAYAEAAWSGLILDEAQFTKNHQSKIHQCARRLPAPFKLAVTGTPMENNLMELWSLLSITAPGLFPSPTRFRDYYVKPIEKGHDAGLLSQFRRRIRPLMLRRTKEQVVSDLPAKQEQVLDVELHSRHRTVYQRRLQRERQKVLQLIDDLDGNRFTILRSLTVLRQLSLHAGLVDETHQELPSVKLDTLVEHLDDVIGGGHRALVFSQFTGFLDKVRLPARH